jgi:hypothetical protein
VVEPKINNAETPIWTLLAEDERNKKNPAGYIMTSAY